jgi:hypothetical protein
MTGNGVSWSAFAATRVSDSKTFGHIIVMNRKTSRSIRVIPHDINAAAKWWMTTGDCIRQNDKCYHKDGTPCEIVPQLEQWGLKVPKREDVKSSSRSFPVWKLCHPSCKKDEVMEISGKYVRVMDIEWPDWPKFFDGSEELIFETHTLKGDSMMCASLASNGWFKGKYQHIASVCDIQRPEAKDVADSRAQIMKELGF